MLRIETEYYLVKDYYYLRNSQDMQLDRYIQSILCCCCFWDYLTLARVCVVGKVQENKNGLIIDD